MVKAGKMNLDEPARASRSTGLSIYRQQAGCVEAHGVGFRSKHEAENRRPEGFIDLEAVIASGYPPGTENLHFGFQCTSVIGTPLQQRARSCDAP